MKLEDWRKEIDEIDGELVRLIARRASIARRIGAHKAAAGLAVVDESREAEVLRKIARQNAGALTDEALVRIFRGIIRESRAIQRDAPGRASQAGEMAP